MSKLNENKKLNLVKNDKVQNKSVKNAGVVGENIKKGTHKSPFAALSNFLKRHTWVLVIAVIFVILAVGAVYAYNYWYNEQYKIYGEKMKIYGFDKLYDNQSVAAYEKVTNSEAIKIILASIYNISDITLIDYDDLNTYPNVLWVSHAEKQGIIPTGKITDKNQDNTISYIDTLKYYLDARNKILEKQITYSKNAEFSDLTAYTTEQQKYINDAAENKLIDNSKFKLKATKKLTKGEFNKLVVKFVEQYNTIVPKGSKVNINEDKLPSNADIYPYILSDIDKSVYEIPFYTDSKETAFGPIETYQMKKDIYDQITQKLEGYFNTILNVDYNTISLESFNDALKPYAVYPLVKPSDENYVDYVKTNKIKLSGKAEIQMPILYFDGRYFRVRTKVDFKIENADKKENLLYCDNRASEAVEYKKDSYSLYLDVSMSMTLDSSSIYVVNLYSISNMVSGKVTNSTEM